jgi:SAM-dependent methyltransferase
VYHLPSLYDILHTPGTAEDVSLYEQIARRYGTVPTRWLEPGCGTGRHLRVLARRGYRAVGFDLDEEMVAYAKRSLARRRLPAQLFCANMEAFSQNLTASHIDIAINPFSTIRHLMSDTAMLRHFSEMANALCTGGLYIVGISIANYATDQRETDLWLANRGRCHVRQQISYTPPDGAGRIEQVESRLLITRPSGQQTHTDGYSLRTYDERQWDALIRKSKLRRRASLDEWGKPTEGRQLPYQLEVLMK